MNIFKFADLVGKKKPYDDFMKSISSNRMVPVLGAGFTKGIRAKESVVPGIEKLKSKLIDIIYKYGNYNSDRKKEFEELDFSAVSNYFFSRVNEDKDFDKEKALEEFFLYMENSYSGVHDMPSYQRDFLQCGWNYLYTLNYDDAIESVLSNYEKVIPYTGINSKRLKDKQCIIKLHGDVMTLINRADLRYCVMSKKQYINTIQDKENKDLMTWLQDDFSSKDLLFIGCSLTNEYDFIFAEGGKASRLSKDESLSAYYVYFDEIPDEEIPVNVEINLSEYGIENILRITPGEIGEFYCFFKEMCKEAQKLSNSDKLNEYSSYSFSIQSRANVEKNINYLFSNTFLGINSLDKNIVLPSFFIHRDVEQDILDSLKRETPICVLSGNRFSGKTYILLGLMQSLQQQKKKVYLISNLTLSNKVLLSIVEKENCVVLFDSGILENRQLQQIFYKNVGKMKKQKLQIVCSINRSDRNFVKVLDDMEHPDPADLSLFCVKTYMSPNERKMFNTHMKDLALTDRNINETFLDFAIRLEENSLKNYPSVMPDTNFLSPDRIEMIECIIVLAVNSTFDNETANLLDIRDELTELCKHVECAVQKDYLSQIEVSSGTHSGVKFVSNSTYWLYRCLSNLAKTASYYETIAQAIKEIVNQYMKNFTRHDGSLDYDVFRKVRPYYYLDTIQKMFFFDAPSRGSLQLPEIIYSELKGTLGNDYQFLHQTAKCKLRVSRRCKDKDSRLEILNQAKRILDRAYEIAEKSRGSNIEYTLAHMKMTETLILTNYLHYCNVEEKGKQKYLYITINCYYYILVEKVMYFKDTEHSLEKDEMSDIKWFINSFLKQDSSMRMSTVDKEYRREVEAIIKGYFNKSIFIDWESSSKD